MFLPLWPIEICLATCVCLWSLKHAGRHEAAGCTVEQAGGWKGEVTSRHVSLHTTQGGPGVSERPIRKEKLINMSHRLSLRALQPSRQVKPGVIMSDILHMNI